MKTDQNSNMQGTLNKRISMKKRRNAKRALLALNLVAVIFTTTVFSNPVSVLSEEVSTDTVQSIENSPGTDAQIAEQADVQQNTAEAAQAVEAPAAEAPAAENSAEAAKAEEPSGVNAPAENAMSAEMNAAEDGVVSTDDGASSASAVQSADTSSASNGSFEDAGAGNTDGTKDGIIENDAEGLNEAEGTAANEESEDAASQEQLTYEDEHVKISVSYTDGRAFTADSILTRTYLDSDEKNAVLSAVNAQISKGNSADTVSDTAENTESSGSAPVASTTATTVEYSVAGFHALMLAAKNQDGSDTTTEGDVTFSAEFKKGLNDAGYASREETTENNEAGGDGSLTTTTTRCETSWKIYTVTEKNLTDITDITDAHNTHYEMDENGTLKSASFRGALPQTVAFVQIVKKTVTETTTQKETEKATEKETQKVTEKYTEKITGKAAEKTTETETEKEDVKAEVPASAAMPAVAFDQKVTTENGTVMVHIDAEEGAFEEGTSMTVTPVTRHDILDKAIDAAGGKGAAAAMDITFTKADGTKTEPLKPIHVKMISPVLNHAEEALVVHVADSGTIDVVARKSDGKTIESTSSEAASSDAKNAVSFESDSFSVYAIVYTVDFFYEGKTWSLPGEGSYRLSDVLAELGIDGEIDNALLSILEGEDHEGALYLEKKSGEYWITSDISFTDTYELRVQIGEKTYSITVTDPPAHARPTTNLNDLVSNFNLTGATANGDGTYTVKPGVSYGVDITFTESERTFQFDNHRELVYELPTGVSLKSINSPFDITVNYLGNNVTISGNTVEIRGGKLVVKLNDGDPNFRKFEAISTAQIRIHGTVEFDQNQSGNDIVIPGGGTYHVDGNTDVRITKSGRITDFESGKVEYTLNVTSVGSNNGVTITDTLEGGAFTRYDASSIKLYDKNGAVVNGANASVSGKTFTMTTGPLQDGNYQLKYVAYLNKSDLTENGNYLGTADDTKNTVTWDGDHETTHNLGHIVEKKTSWKGAGSSTTNEQGIATTPWTITAYTSPLERLANVGDEIQTTGTIYSGTGFDVKITDVITNQVVGTTHVDWSAAGKTDTTWSYDFRNLPGYPNEGKYWKYDITYTTQTNMSNATQSQQIVNEGGPDNDKHTGTGTVNPPEANRTRIEKTAVSVGDNNEVTWRIKLTIPKTGVDSTRSFVTEHLPSSGRYKDTYVEGSFQFEGTAPAEGMPAITVLENGDVEFRWAKFNSSSDKRTITFTFRSKYDPAWIADENAAKYHANDAEFNGEHSYDGTTYNTPVFKKVGSTIIEENGEFYFDFDVRTNKITNGSFGENGTGTITFTDTYDSRLEFVEGSVRIYGGDSEGNITATNDNARPTASPAASGNTVTFTVGKSMLPTKYGQLQDGSWGDTGELYPYYRLHYRMKVKNFSTLQSEALTLETLTIKMDNTITSDIGNDTTTVEYTPEVLDKWQSANMDADTVNHKGKVQFTIHVNAAQLDLAEGDILTLYDKLENISTAYQDIDITFPKNNYEKGDVTTTIPETGQTVELPYFNMKGDTVTFYLPDGVDTLITYWAKPTGEVGPDGKIHYTNTAKLKGFEKKVEESADWSGDASGLATQYGVKLYKADGYENSRLLAGAQFKLFMVDEEDEDGNILSGTPMQTLIKDGDTVIGTKDKIFTTTSDGTINIEGDEADDGWNLKPEQRYYLLEVKAPEGMAIDSTKYSFIISSKGYTNYTSSAIVAPDGSGAIVQPWTYYNGDVLTVKDWPKEGELEITKNFDQDGDTTSYEEMTAEQKSAITFKVYQKQTDESWKLIKNIGFDQFVAGEDGVPKFKVGDLKAGIYKVVEEINTDMDTTCKEQTYQVTLDQDSVEAGDPKYVVINITEDDIRNHTAHAMSVTNRYVDESEFKIYKYADQGIEGKTELRLAGAEFAVYTTSDGAATNTKVGSNYKTNGRGLFYIRPSTDTTGIQYNTLYALKEEKAPDGYELSDTWYYFYFVGDGSTAPSSASLPPGTTIIPYKNSVQKDVPNEIGTTSIGVKKVWQNDKLEDLPNKNDPVEVKVKQIATLDKEGKNIAVLGEGKPNPKYYPSDSFLFKATKSDDKWNLEKKVATAQLPEGVTIENGRLTGLPAMMITDNGIPLYYHYEIEEVVPQGYAASYTTDTEESGGTTVTIVNRPDSVQSFVKLQAEKKWFVDEQDITGSMGVDDSVVVDVYRKEGVVTDGIIREADGTEKSAADLFTLLTRVEQSTQAPIQLETASVITLPNDQIQVIFKPQNTSGITASDFVVEVGKMDQYGNLNGKITLENPVIDSGKVIYTYPANAAHNTIRVKVTQNKYVKVALEVVNASAKGRTQILTQNDANAVGGSPVEALILDKAHGWKATSKEYSGGSGIVVYSYYLVERNGENYDSEYVVDGDSIIVKNVDKRLRVDKKWFRPDGTTEMEQQDGSIVYNLYQVRNGREWKENQFSGDGPFSVSISEFMTGDPNNIGQNQPTIHFAGDTSGIRPGSKVKITITKDNPNNGNMDIQDTSWASAFTVTGGTATIGSPYTINGDDQQARFKVREILVEDVSSSIKLSGYMNIQGGNVWIDVEVLGEYDSVPVTDETQMTETRVGQITMTYDSASIELDPAFAESGIKVKPDKGAWTSVISKLPERNLAGDTYTYYVTEESISLDSFEYYGIDNNNVGNGHTVTIKNKAKPAKVRVTKAFDGIPNLPSGFKITNSFNDSEFTVDNIVGGDGSANNPYYWEIDNLVIGQEISFYEWNFGLDDKETTVYDNAGNLVDSPYKVTATAVEEITGSAAAPGVTGYVNKYKNKPGALKFTKLVTYNGSGENLTAEQKSLVDGTYTFTVTGPDGAPDAEQVLKYVRIVVSGGLASSYSVADGNEEEDWEAAVTGTGEWAIVDKLYEGVYTITETGKNGLTLTGITRVDGNTSNVFLSESKVKVTVVANDTTAAQTSAQAKFTNDYKRIEVTKLWKDETGGNKAWPGDISSIELTLKRKVGSGSDADYLKLTVPKPTGTEPSDVTIAAAASGGTVPEGVTATVAQKSNTASDGYVIKVNGLPGKENGSTITYSFTESELENYKVSYAYANGQTTQESLTAAPDGGTVINTPLTAVSLPSTGGPGTRLFYGSGIAFLAVAGILLFIRRKRTRDFSEGRW